MDLVRWLELGARAIAVTLTLFAGAVAATHWAVRRRYLAPFGWWSRTTRQLSDPLLRPLETRLLRSGHNPQDASLWLVGVAVVAGLGVLALVRWTAGLFYSLTLLGHATPLTAVRMVIGWALGLVMTALLIRVIAGWLGVSPASRLLRLTAKVTDWIVVPVRRYLPQLGPLDLSPAIAYLILLLLRTLLAA